MPPKRSRIVGRDKDKEKDKELDPPALPNWLAGRMLCCAGLLLLVQNLVLLGVTRGVEPNCLELATAQVHEDVGGGGAEAVAHVLVPEEKAEDFAEEGVLEEEEEEEIEEVEVDVGQQEKALDSGSPHSVGGQPALSIRNQGGRTKDVSASSAASGFGPWEASPATLAARKDLRLFGERPPAPLDYCIGISSIRRPSAKTEYVVDAVKTIFTHSAEAAVSSVVVVHLADAQMDWVARVADQFRQSHASAIAEGRFHAIHAPEDMYPNLDTCPPYCPFVEKPDFLRWQSKRNVDYAILIAYSLSLAQFYLQLEDDIEVKPNFLRHIASVVAEQPNVTADGKSPWRAIDFQGLPNCYGKLFQSDVLSRLSKYFLMFYDQQPCEALVLRWMRSMTQGDYIRSKTPANILWHIGEVDSTPGNRKHRDTVSCGSGRQGSGCAQCLTGKYANKASKCAGDCTYAGDACSLMGRAREGSPAQVPIVQPDAPVNPAPAVPSVMIPGWDNPPGTVVSDMMLVPTFEPRFAYMPGGEPQQRDDSCDFKVSPFHRRHSGAGGRACWFWAKTPKANEHLTLVFNSEITMEKFSIDIGHPAHQADIIINGVLEVASTEGVGTKGQLSYPLNQCGTFQQVAELGSKFSFSWSGSPALPVDVVKCLRVRMVESQAAWLIIQKILVKSGE